jgi:hypothetical protein
MFRSMLAGRSRRRAAIVAGALAGVLTPLAAHAATGLVLSVQLAPGAAGATQTVAYLTPQNSNTDIPVYVYATVTGANPATAGNYQGFQYAYYNVLDANAPGSGIGVSPTLDAGTTAFTNETPLPANNPAYNFAANGSYIGSTANGGSGILAGSTTVLSDIAHVRSASDGPVWNGTSVTAGDSYVNGNSVSFLVETLEVKPTAFTASTTAAGGQNYSKFSVSIPNITSPSLGGPEYQGANWNQDSTSNTGDGSTASIKNGTYSGSTSFVTFEDTLLGDANGNGTVDINDVNTTVLNFGKAEPWSGGDFDGAATVDINDINDVILGFGKTLTNITPTVLTDLAQISAANPGDTVLSSALSAVPEPASLSVLALAGAATMMRRRRSAR